MEFSQQDDHNKISLARFESMLKTNHVLFFDSNEFENIIHHYLEIGKIGFAKRAIKLGLEQHPSSINLRLYRTEIFIIEDSLDKADNILQELYTLDPNNPEIYIQKANVLSKNDKHLEAVKSLLFALDLSEPEEDNGDIFALIGMEYLFMEKYQSAGRYFVKCIELDHFDYAALYNIVFCFDVLEKNDEAIEYLNSYIDKNPYSEVAWHQLGRQYMILKDYEKAITAFDFAIISDEEFLGAYLEKGKVLEKLGKYEDAIHNYEITLALDEPTSFALLRMGYCHEKLGKQDLAVKFYYKTVYEDPLLDKGWLAITKYYFKKKNFQKALYYINKAINIDADNVKYWKLYARINQRLNFLEEAERGYKRTIELGNYEIDTWLSRADILINLGEYNTAINNLNQAAEFYPENAEIEYRLGGLNILLHENEKGLFHLKNGVMLDEDFHFIIDELFPSILKIRAVKNLIAKTEKS